MFKEYTLMALIALLVSAPSAWAAQDIERQQNLDLEPISADYFSELEDIINLGEENGANGEDVAALLFNNKRTAISKPHVDDGISNRRQGQKRKRAEADNQRLREKRFSCSYPECDFKGSDRSALKVHLRTHTGEKPFECGKCEKFFSHKSNCRNHIKTQHEGEEVEIRTKEKQKFKCIFCEKEFASKSYMIEHERIHTGEKTQVCMHDGCGKAFSSTDTLRNHIQRHHPDDMPYACRRACGSKFKLRINRRSHEAICEFGQNLLLLQQKQPALAAPVFQESRSQ